MRINQIILSGSLFISAISSAQFVVFQESIGTISSNTTLQQHILNKGFDSKTLQFSSGDSIDPVEVRSSSNSSGAYTQFNNQPSSGGANLWFSSTGVRGFGIEAIRAGAFDSLQLYFAYRKENLGVNASFRVEWSINNGLYWDSIPMNGLPAENASTGWYYLGPFLLPTAASVNALSIRWRTQSGAMRIDDIALVGKLVKPLLIADAVDFNLTSTENSGASLWESLSIETHGFQLNDTVFINCPLPFVIHADTLNGGPISFIQLNAPSEQISLWVRMLDTSRNSYQDSLVLYAENADALRLNLKGICRYAGEELFLWDCQTIEMPFNNDFIEFSPFLQGNNHGTTQFLSGSAGSEGYSGASAGNNAALTVKSGNLDIANSSYIAWSIKAAEEKELRLLGLSFGGRSTSLGPQAWSLRSSMDGFQNELAAGTLIPNAQWYYIDEVINEFNLTDSQQFRLYFFGGTGNPPMNSANFRLDDVQLSIVIWNNKALATFQSNGSGGFADSSIWTYNYYQNLYRTAYSVPDSNQNVIIGLNDSLVLFAAQIAGTIELQGLLNLNAKQLSVKGKLKGTGKIVGHRESKLVFSGAGDTSILCVDQRQPGNSNAISALVLEGGGRIYLSDTVILYDYLDLKEGLLFSQSTLRLRTKENGAPAQILPSGNGNISGAICMQWVIPGNQNGWRAFSSPLDTVTLGQLGTQIDLQTKQSAGGLSKVNAYTWEEASSSWVHADQPAQVFRKNPINVYVSNPNNRKIEVCGLLDTSAVNFGKLSFNPGNPQEEGWHLISNPYPWHLRWSAVESIPELNSHYAIWSATDGNYRHWNGVVGAAGHLIPPGHGFWVKVNAPLSKDFVLRRSLGDTGNINHFGKKSGFEYSLSIQLKDPNSPYQDQLDLFRNNSPVSTNHVPKLDGNKEAPELWVEEIDKRWSIFNLSEKERIPIAMKAPESGNYLIYVMQQGHSNENWILVDAESNKRYPLNENSSINVVLNKGTSKQRFYLEKSLVSLSKMDITSPFEFWISEKKLRTNDVNSGIASIYSMDGRLLETLPPQVTSEGTLHGPLGVSNGIFIIQLPHSAGIYRQMIYLR